MEIYELNNFSGSLDQTAFVAVDNGSDTGKASIKEITDPLNARIDNIIAGPASSAEEVIDARLGADGVTYASLGDAIRTQFSNVKNDYELQELGLAQMLIRNLANQDDYAEGYYKHNDPTVINHGANTWYLPKIRILKGLTYSFRSVYAYFSAIIYDDGTVSALTQSASPATTNVTITATKNGYAYVTVNNAWTGSAMVVEGYAPYSGAYFKGFGGALKVHPTTAITANNYATYLPTLDSAEDNTVYKLITTAAMTASGTMTDVPDILKSGTHTAVLFNIGHVTSSPCTQILFVPVFSTIDKKSKIYTRYLNEVGGVPTWTPWETQEQKVVIIAADGSGDFTSFTEGMLYATQYRGSHVYVMPGTYDIISEYESLYGASFFTNYSEQETDHGVRLWNDVVVEFCPNAKLVCNYQGNNTNVQHLFSPLNSGSYGFTLINCVLEDHNVRYSMHDERGSQADYYHNKYIGCRFKHDKGTGSGYIQAVGGGLGKNGLVEIENCIFESVTSEGSIVSWHNSASVDARSQVFIRNSMIKGNARFSYYGPSTLISTMIITGCKMFSDPVKTQESQDYNVDNVEILAWGNDISQF